MNEFVHMEGVEFDGPRSQSTGSSGTTRIVGESGGGGGGRDRGAERVMGLAKGKASCEGVAVHQLLKPGNERGARHLITTTPGGGVVGTFYGVEIIVGTAKFLIGRDISVPEEPALQAGSVIHVARDGVYLGLFVLKDRLRPSAPALVAYFAGQGIAVTLLSGDRPEHVREIAGAAGIVDAHGGMLPADKAGYVTEREGEGELVLMVGDGINDAPALSAASVGCAMAGGTDIALETSSLILTKPDLGRIRLAHHLSVRTMRVIRQNLAWAFVYNLIGIPLAMTGRLTPIYAAAAMALSSLCVVGNSLRLTRMKG